MAELREYEKWPETTKLVGTPDDMTLVLRTVPTLVREVSSIAPLF
jgi:hypothetical protein